MKSYYINEDNRPKKIPVTYSPDVIEKIELIKKYNSDKKSKLLQWCESIDDFINYLSNPVIAWDYTNKYIHSPNGETYLKEFGYEVTYTIKTNESKGQNYVYIIQLNLSIEEFELDRPDYLNDNVQYMNPINKGYRIITSEKTADNYHKLLIEYYHNYLQHLFR